MLCRLTEGGVCKCARYWPETTSDVAKDSDAGFEIKLLSEEVSIERNFFNSAGPLPGHKTSLFKQLVIGLPI